MSTVERVEQRLDPYRHESSTALVPLVGDGGGAVRIATRPGPGPGARTVAHAFWYGGLALFVVGAWLTPRGGDEAWYVLGVLCLLFGGVAGLVYTFWRVSEAKLRNALGALAALALTIAAIPRLSDVSREVYATALIPRAQPLAEALARDGRIRHVAFGREWVALNTYNGPESGPPVYDARATAGGRTSTSLEEVLRGDGITRAELDAYRRRFAGAGFSGADVARGGLVLYPADTYDLRLLYVPPGQVLPPLGMLGAQYSRWRSHPMGGGWYLLRAG